MSVDRCSRCSALVDTDNEPEAYVQIADMRKREEYICLCRGCRDDREREPRTMPPNWQPTPEQQAFIDAREAEDDDEDPITKLAGEW